MTPLIITLSLLIPSKLGRINSGTDLGTGYGGTVCGFHTRPFFADQVELTKHIPPLLLFFM